MRAMTIREARASLSRLEKLLEAEGELMITKRGEPVARVVRVGARRAIPSHADLREAMPRLKEGSEEFIRRDRDGR